ncbi:MAG: inositol monophosphatase family protein [Thermoplasmatota archaeon]
MNYDEYLELAKSSALEAGKIITENFGERLEVDHKGKYDLVTKMDMKSEKYIVDSINERFPDHDIVTEETDLEKTGSDYVWYIDPISGTTNYAHSLPVFSVSIGLTYEGEVIAGAANDPLRKELFYASKDDGAFLNDEKIHVSNVKELKDSVLGTSFSYDEEERKINLQHFNKLMPNVQGLRRSGSVAVDLPHVACGRMDGFWAIHLKPWDLAAGKLIVKEAGGKVTKLIGDKHHVKESYIMATNGEIHDEMIELLNS